MNRALTLLVFAGVALSPSTAGSQQPAAAPPEPDSAVAEPSAPAPRLPEAQSTLEKIRDEVIFRSATRAAWSYVERQYQPSTGLVNSVIGYPYATVWDIASGLAALFSAHELGLLPRDEYDRRMQRALRTLREAPLFEGIAYNKNYSTRTGRIAGRNDRVKATARGHGWSATDIGRLLVWLKIIAENHPRFATEIDAVVARIDLERMVRDGYLWGGDLDRQGRVRTHTEGRIPYEQYAAAGFALWGHRAQGALSLEQNALPIEVLGVPLVADRRGHDHLTSEPLVLMGLELGWPPDLGELAANLLRVQEERFRQTGQVTMLSEDAVPLSPHYFFYYTVNYHGDQFVVVTQSADSALTEPRWVSAKAAFGWHALLPSRYTWRAVEEVAGAEHPERGWSSGVFEETGRPTGSENINTAAVILEAALYRQRGRPLIRTGAEPGPASAASPPRP